MTFGVMNKVMNNFKKQDNSIVIQSVNENVIPFTRKNSKNPSFYWGFFYFNENISDEGVMKV